MIVGSIVLMILIVIAILLIGLTILVLVDGILAVVGVLRWVLIIPILSSIVLPEGRPSVVLPSLGLVASEIVSVGVLLGMKWRLLRPLLLVLRVSLGILVVGAVAVLLVSFWAS